MRKCKSRASHGAWHMIHIHEAWALTNSSNVTVASSSVILFWLLTNNVSRAIEGSACCTRCRLRRTERLAVKEDGGERHGFDLKIIILVSCGAVLNVFMSYHWVPLKTILWKKKKKKPVTFQPSHFLDLTCPVTIHHFNLEEGVVSPDLEVGLDLLRWFSRKGSFELSDHYSSIIVMGKLKAQSSWVSHMAHQSHGKKSPLETLQRHVLEEKSPIKYLSAFLKYLVCRSHDCAGMLLLSHYCVCMSGVLCRGPGSSPTSGVVTRGASLASLSVVLLSVSESDSELLSESLELPDPPLVGAAGGGWRVAKSGLKGKWHHWLPLLLPNWLEKSPGGHEDWSSVRARRSGVCRSISQTGTMRLRRPREWPTVPSCFFFLSFSVKIHFQLLSCSEIPRFV